MSNFNTIDDLDVRGKRVLVRCDLNVPMKDGNITDATRIDRSLPTIRDLLAGGAGVIVMSHFGRPKGMVVQDMSLRPVADALAKRLGRDVAFAGDCIGDDAERAAQLASAGGVAMLENLRFHAEEEANDAAFAGKLAELGNIYVNDAFSCAHRAHASTEAIAKLLPSAAGRLMQAELVALGDALENPERPVAALVGGAKISSKMTVLGHLVSKVDMLIIGGGMANTFLYAQGIDVGKSLCEADMADDARGILTKAAEAGCEIVLPIDAVVAREFAEGAASETVLLDAIPADAMMLDVGPASVADLIGRLGHCKTLVWNGPLGAFEVKPFDTATNALASEAAKLTAAGSLLSVAGGGDTVAALANAGVQDQFTYVSTAGGAFLEWLEGKELPGVAALSRAD
ncbi:MAG TPA: phosphoglycerate kinase [Rhodospirillales bacterium]|nr:MAG: Phosphoglycerate kinase [Alphaproteobacteria bacterium MarineAlpha3_Bin2]HIM77069.1 phosphoglycerate kinase [Rhodospirillales bacterium]